MGNTFGTQKKSSFDDPETSPFSCSERDSIELCYEKICSSDADPSVSKAYILHPNLLRLLKRKGILLSLGAFTAFLGDAMRVNSSGTIKAFWELLIIDDTQTTGRGRLLTFFSLLLSLMSCGETLEDEDTSAARDNSAELLVDAVMRQNPNLSDKSSDGSDRGHENSYEYLNKWMCIYGPCIPKVFESYLTEKCLQSVIDAPIFPFLPPNLNAKSDLLVNGTIDLIPLSLYSDALQGNWNRLYSSSSEGLSFNRMIYHILGYEGPLCFLIKPRHYSNTIFGAFTSGKWKESNRFYGSSDAFIFTISPEFNIMRSRDRSNSNYQWLNTKSYGMPHGLALGGSMGNFRLFISESFENCTAAESCLTFEVGDLLPDTRDTMSIEGKKEFDLMPKNKFDIDFLEVWATGGAKFIDQGLQALSKDRQIKDENIQKARKVDKAQFFNNTFDQEFLLSSSFSHRTQAVDRQDCPAANKISSLPS